jgi:hypothetical protein
VRLNNIGTKVVHEIFIFFDSVEYLNLLLLARKNKIAAGRMKGDVKIGKVIDTLSIIGNKFGISRTSVSQIKKIKKQGGKKIIDQVMSGEISVDDAYSIVNGGQKQRKCVYFIQDVNSNRIKIGKSKMLNRRYDKLKRNNAGDLKLLLSIDGYSSKETMLHRKFLQYRLHGEWFEPAQEILDYIDDRKVEKYE